MASSEAIEHLKHRMAESLCNSLYDLLRRSLPEMTRTQSEHWCVFHSRPNSPGVGYVDHQQTRLKIYFRADEAAESDWATAASAHGLVLEKRRTIKRSWESRTPFFAFIDPTTIEAGGILLLKAAGAEPYTPDVPDNGAWTAIFAQKEILHTEVKKHPFQILAATRSGIELSIPVTNGGEDRKLVLDYGKLNALWASRDSVNVQDLNNSVNRVWINHAQGTDYTNEAQYWAVVCERERREAHWSKQEIAAAVAAYFAMLKLELDGQRYSKSAHRKALLSVLPSRSGPAVEFKHCNISAVLRDNDLTYIDGYKPRGNYQKLLADMVREYLESHPDLRKAVVEADAHALVSVPDGSQFTFKQIEVPAPIISEQPTKATGKPAKIDWAVVTSYNRDLGKQGEEFVRDLEKRRLTDAGRADLAAEVEMVSSTKGDGAGFDIRSFDAAGQEILIEVKTTTGPEGAPFFITSAELECSEKHGAKYWLYRLFSFKNNPKLYRVPGPLKLALSLKPTVYRCSGSV